jgi:hypothetical protein
MSDHPFSNALRAAVTAAATSSGVAWPDLGERLLGRRRDRRVRLLGLEPLASYEVAVALLERDDVARLGCRRVRPVRRDRCAILLSLELSQR